MAAPASPSALLICGLALRGLIAWHGLWGAPASYVARVALSSETTDWPILYDSALGLQPPGRPSIVAAAVGGAHQVAGALGARAVPVAADLAGAAALYALSRACGGGPAAAPGAGAAQRWAARMLALWCFCPAHLLAAAGGAASAVIPAAAAAGVAAVGSRWYMVAAVLFGASVQEQPSLVCMLPALLAAGGRVRGACAAALFAAAWWASSVAAAGGGPLLPPSPEALCRCTRPNWGFHWYLQMEMFKEFRALFCAVFISVSLGLAVPLTFKIMVEPRLGHAAELATAASYALAVLLAPQPTMVDYCSAGLILCAAAPGALAGVRYQLALLWACVLCITLGSVFLVAWLIHRSANANFFFFVTIAWNLTLVAALMQVLQGRLRLHREHEQRRQQ